MKSVILALLFAKSALAQAQTEQAQAFLQTIGANKYLMVHMGGYTHQNSMFQSGQMPKSCGRSVDEVCSGTIFENGSTQKHQVDGSYICGGFSDEPLVIGGDCASMVFNLGDSKDCDANTAFAVTTEYEFVREGNSGTASLPYELTTSPISDKHICKIDGKCGQVNGLHLDPVHGTDECRYTTTKSPTPAPTEATINAVWEFVEPKVCTKSCGGGVLEQTCTQGSGPEHLVCDKVPKLDAVFCNDHKCDEFPWSDWSACDRTCGGGIQIRNCPVSGEMSENGVDRMNCTNDGLGEEKPCNEKECPECNYPKNCQRQANGALKNKPGSMARGDGVDITEHFYTPNELNEYDCDCTSMAALVGSKAWKPDDDKDFCGV